MVRRSAFLINHSTNQSNNHARECECALRAAISLFAERHPEFGSVLIPNNRNLQTLLIPHNRLHSLLALAITHPPLPIAFITGFGHYSSSITATAVSGSSSLAHPEFSQCRPGGVQGAEGTATAVCCSFLVIVWRFPQCANPLNDSSISIS